MDANSLGSETNLSIQRICRRNIGEPLSSIYSKASSAPAMRRQLARAINSEPSRFSELTGRNQWGDLPPFLVLQRFRQYDERVFGGARRDFRIGAHQPHRALGLDKGETVVARHALFRLRAHPAVEEHH